MERILVLMSRVGSLFRRKELDARLDEELGAHVDLAIAETAADRPVMQVGLEHVVAVVEGAGDDETIVRGQSRPITQSV